MKFENIMEYMPYELGKVEKKSLLTKRLNELTKLHFEQCPEYRRILESSLFDINGADSYESLPFLPVRLFKELSLKSVKEEDVFKVMTSSGTTGQAVSKIYLDKVTSANQQKAMVKIVSDFTGSARMPMIIIDCPSVIKNRAMFSARGAGILGFSIFGSKKIYALDDDMKLDVEGVTSFLEQHKGEKIFLFGFTFMIWQHFYKELEKLKEEGIRFDLSNAVMIHGGGWKKLISEAVSPEEFHDRLHAVCGLDRIHDYYGMVEQTGCIYMQCECGHLHASVFSDVITRRPKDFSVCDFGEKGIIQVVSTIPESYPGHSLLTEDEGVILGEDDCPCGRKGKYFKIIGRLKDAEIRGCSDTYAADHSNMSDIAKQNTKRAAVQDSGEDILRAMEACAPKLQFLTGDKEIVGKMLHTPAKKMFDEEILAFCNELSKEIMGSPDAKAYPDIITLGFWLRKSSLAKMKERFCHSNDWKLGRGIAFHIAPSNVPVNFAYSLFAGLLTGNRNIVRVPSKPFPQVEIVANAINQGLLKYDNLKNFICLVRYDRDREVNDFFSSICDARIIWGGDATIAELRKSPLPPRATEVTFADRYSLAFIDADEYLHMEHKERVALDFYNDTYLSDQNACTSPRVVAWYGGKIEEAKEVFWKELHHLVEKKYLFQPIQGVDKLSLSYLSFVQCKKEQLCFETGCRRQDGDGTSIIGEGDNLITRIRVGHLTEHLMEYRGNSGYFYEYHLKDVMELRSLGDNARCQTVGIIGDRSCLMPLLQSGIQGIDRIVPIGHTMDFDLVWDGYDLTERLTRTVAIN